MILEWTDIQNNKICKNNPLKITIHTSQTERCDSMTVVYRDNGNFTSIREVKFIFDDKTVFRGMVDSQTVTHKNHQHYLEIHCRTLAGYLTDNEIQPQNINNITDSVIFADYLEPFGIEVQHILNRPYNGMMNIGKSRSIYDFIENYCQNVFHTAFRVDSQGTAFFGGECNPVTYYFTDSLTDLTQNAYAYTSIRIENNRKEIISQVRVKHSVNENDYGLVIQNSYAQTQNIQRVCYLDATPSGGKCIFDATKMIETANQKATVITIECPCFVYNALGGKAVVCYQNRLFDNGEIVQADYHFENGKIHSILKISQRSDNKTT